MVVVGVSNVDPLDYRVRKLHRKYIAIVEDHLDTLLVNAEVLSSLGFTVATANSYDEAMRGPVTIWMPTLLPKEHESDNDKYRVDKYTADTGLFPLNPDLLIVDHILSRTDTPIKDPSIMDDPRKIPPTGLDYAIYFRFMEGNVIGESEPLTDIFILSAQTDLGISAKASQLGIRYFTKPVEPHRLAELAMSIEFPVSIGILETASRRNDILNLLARTYLEDRGKPYSKPTLLTGKIGRTMGKIKGRIPMVHGAYVRINADDAVAFADVFEPNQASSSDDPSFVIKKAGSEDVVERMHRAYISFHRRKKRFPQPRYFNESHLVLNTFLSGISGYYFLRRIDDLVVKGLIPAEKGKSYKRAYLTAVLNWSWECDEELRRPTRAKDGLDDRRVPLDYTVADMEKITKDTADKLRYVYTSLAGFYDKNGLVNEKDPRLPKFQMSFGRLKQAIDFYRNLIFGAYGINWKLDIRSQNIVFEENLVTMTDEEFMQMLATRERRGMQRSLEDDYGQYEIAPRCEDRFRFEDRISAIFAPELGHYGTGLPRSEQVNRLFSEIQRLEHKYRGRFSPAVLAQQWEVDAEGGFFTASRNAQIIKALYKPRLVMAFWQRLIDKDQFGAQMATYQREQDYWFELKDWFAAMYELTAMMQISAAAQQTRGPTYQQIGAIIRATLTNGAESQYMRELDQKLSATPLPLELRTDEEKAIAPYNFSREFRKFYRPNGLIHRIEKAA